MKGSTRISSFTLHSLLLIQKLDSFGLRPQNYVKNSLSTLLVGQVCSTDSNLPAPSARYPDLFASLTSSPLTKQFTGLFCSAECKSATLAFLFQIRTMNLLIRHRGFLKLPAREAVQLKAV